jgi:hypothetical protein
VNEIFHKTSVILCCEVKKNPSFFKGEQALFITLFADKNRQSVSATGAGPHPLSAGKIIICERSSPSSEQMKFLSEEGKFFYDQSGFLSAESEFFRVDLDFRCAKPEISRAEIEF